MTNPIPDHIDFQIHSWEQVPPGTRELRYEVFVQEQKVPEEIELDEQDASAMHVVATTASKEVIGCARFFPKENNVVYIGRMAVKKAYRNQGLGDKMLKKAIEGGIVAYQASQFALSAQSHALDFYARNGFLVNSDEYLEAGIPHIKMVLSAPKNLLHALEEKTLYQHGKTPLVAGEDPASWFFGTPDLGNELATCCLFGDIQNIDVFDTDLSHTLYQSSAFIDQLSEVTRTHRRCRVRILLCDDQTIARRPHPLIELARRLTSKISLKVVSTDYPTDDECYLLAGRYNLFYRKCPSEIAGFCDFNRPDRVKVYRDKFDEMWKRAKRSREFNTFGL